MKIFQPKCSMEEQKSNRFLLGILSAIMGAFIGAIPFILVYVFLNYIVAMLTALIAAASFYAYRLTKAKIDKKLPVIVALSSVLSITVAIFIIIPLVLMAREGIDVSFKNLGIVYKFDEFKTAIIGDYIKSLIFGIIGVGVIVATLREQIKQGKSAEEKTAEGKNKEEKESEPPAIDGLVYVEAMETAFAETFDIYTYRLSDGSAEDTCRLIDVHDSGSYLILPESGSAGKSAAWQKTADAVPASITVLQAPLDNLYVAATSSMALFDAAGAIEQVKLTGTKADGWYIDAPKKALAEGSMTYAGKYSAPDYELLAASDWQLAVESMMILHTPEVKEKLEELGIPVFIDTSSNESHPMGRTEWVRLYGVLTGHETEAEAFFEKEKERFAEAETYTDTGLTAAFFSISSSGNVIVRATDDYIPRMIELAGGKYIFKDLLNESGNSASVRLSMEDFYNMARDADYLIYNATIENPVKSIEELCGRSALLSDFKAVQEGHVWQVQRSLYQSPDIAARMITDLRLMLTGGDAQEMTFLEQLK